MDGEENLYEEKLPPSGGVAFVCVDSFQLLTTSIRLLWKVEKNNLQVGVTFMCVDSF